MPISLIKEEEEHILKILPVLLKRDSEFKNSLYSILGETFVKKDDFSELKDIVKELGVKVGELASAQVEIRKELKELVSAQKKTEMRINELAEAQNKTENAMKTIAITIKDIQKHLGGLDHTIGFYLEDESYKALPNLLKRDMGLEIIGRLVRQYVEIKPNRYIETNIFGNGRMDGKEYIVIGEAKTQLKKSDVDEFIKRAETLQRFINKRQIRVLVTYQAHPTVQRYVDEKGIKLYFSYNF